MNPPAPTQPALGADLLNFLTNVNADELQQFMSMNQMMVPATPVNQTRFGRIIKPPAASPGAAAQTLAALLASSTQAPQATPGNHSNYNMSAPTSTSMNRPLVANGSTQGINHGTRAPSSPSPAATPDSGPSGTTPSSIAPAEPTVPIKRGRGRPRVYVDDDVKAARKQRNKESAASSRAKKKDQFEQLTTRNEAQEAAIQELKETCEGLERYIAVLQKTLRDNGLHFPSQPDKPERQDLEAVLGASPTAAPEAAAAPAPRSEQAQPPETVVLIPRAHPLPAPVMEPPRHVPMPTAQSGTTPRWIPPEPPVGTPPPMPALYNPRATTPHSSPISFVRGEPHNPAALSGGRTPTSLARDADAFPAFAPLDAFTQPMGSSFHGDATMSLTPAIPPAPSIPDPLKMPMQIDPFVGGDNYMSLSLSWLLDPRAMEEDDPTDATFVPPTSPGKRDDDDSSDDESEFEEEGARSRKRRKRMRLEPVEEEDEDEDEEDDADGINVAEDEDEDLFMPIEDVPHPQRTPEPTPPPPPPPPEPVTRAALRDLAMSLLEERERGPLSPEKMEWLQKLLALAQTWTTGES